MLRNPFPLLGNGLHTALSFSPCFRGLEIHLILVWFSGLSPFAPPSLSMGDGAGRASWGDDISNREEFL
jgi:hypothetical protein